MKKILQKADAPTRRAFVSGAAKSFLGLTAMSTVFRFAGAREFQDDEKIRAPKPVGEEGEEDEERNPNPTAKNVIYIYLAGGMSHLDTFDPKPGAETQGPVDALATSADGVRISQYFPLTAQQMHHVAVVNSMTSTQGAHAQGRYFMHTSYFMRGTITHPDMGAWSNYHLGRRNPTLPGNVKILGGSTSLGGGFLESKYAALPIGNPEDGMKNSSITRGITPDRFERRLRRAAQMNQQFRDRYNQKQVNAYSDMYDDAVRLMRSEDLAAFDLTMETDSVREMYGADNFGQACLLARRLVENEVRFIEIENGGWDTHTDNFTRLEEKCAVLDQGLAALIGDLSDRGLLDETMVVLATEFGRTPDIVTERNGRNHYPKAFSCLLAGGGVKGGIAHGKTDKEGREVVEDLVEVPDFNATIAWGLGIPLRKKVISPSRRPFTVADKGNPILSLYS